MLNIIIFSKNRPPQLELFLRSMKKYFKEFSSFKIIVIYIGTSNEFIKGYELAKTLHPDIVWQEEQGFQNTLISVFDRSLKYSVFFVDDNIFKEPFSLNDEEFKYFDSHGDILTLSLRLHPRLTYCYPASCVMSPPEFKKYNVFEWKGGIGDYGYPMSLDGHIFRTRDIYYFILNLRYDGPNSLEAQMAAQPLPYPKMMCYNKSIIMNNPANKVQEYNNNVHGNISIDYLNSQFLSGNIINLKTYEGFENTSCHQEMPINFIQN